MSDAPSRGRAVAILLPVVTAGLLGAAVWTVVRDGEAVAGAWRAVRSAPAWLGALLPLLSLVNWVLTAAMLLVLTGRYGRVGAGEMGALVGAAWLLNLLPLRPGIATRAAYHRVVNGIALADTARVVVWSFGIGIAAIPVALLAGLAAARVGGALGAGALALPTLAAAGCAWVLRARGYASWRLACAGAIRYADTLATALRYWAAFALIGREMDPVDAVVIAAGSQLAGMTPVQLGLREWVVGLTAAALAGTGGPGAVVPGLTADLVARAGELVVALPVGLAGAGWMWARLGRARTSGKVAP